MMISITFSRARIEIESEDAELLAKTLNYFKSGGGVQSAGSEGSHPVLRVLIHLTGDFSSREKDMLSGAAELLEAPQLAIRRKEYLSGGKLYFSYPAEKSLCLFDYERRLVEIWTGQDQVKTDAFRFLWVVLGDVLRLALRFYGWCYIHASGVAKGPAGLIFTAPGGSGKSTLAFQFALKQYAYFSDDMLALRANQGGVEMCPSPDWLGMRPAAMSHFSKQLPGLMKDSRLLCESDKKFAVPMGKLFHRQSAEETRPRFLLQLALRQDGPPSLERVPKVQALHQLLLMSSLSTRTSVLPGLPEMQFDLLGRLVNQTETYRLAFSWECLEEIFEYIEDKIYSEGPA